MSHLEWKAGCNRAAFEFVRDHLSKVSSRLELNEVSIRNLNRAAEYVLSNRTTPFTFPIPVKSHCLGCSQAMCEAMSILMGERKDVFCFHEWTNLLGPCGQTHSWCTTPCPSYEEVIRDIECELQYFNASPGDVSRSISEAAGLIPDLSNMVTEYLCITSGDSR